MVDSKDAEGNIFPFPGTSRKLCPTAAQRAWLNRGLKQPGGKLPLFDEEGQHYSTHTINSCVEQGWAEPWFNNTMKQDWTVCRLTAAGRKILGEDEA